MQVFFEHFKHVFSHVSYKLYDSFTNHFNTCLNMSIILNHLGPRLGKYCRNYSQKFFNQYGVKIGWQPGNFWMCYDRKLQGFLQRTFNTRLLRLLPTCNCIEYVAVPLLLEWNDTIMSLTIWPVSVDLVQVVLQFSRPTVEELLKIFSVDKALVYNLF